MTYRHTIPCDCGLPDHCGDRDGAGGCGCTTPTPDPAGPCGVCGYHSYILYSDHLYVPSLCLCGHAVEAVG